MTSRPRAVPHAPSCSPPPPARTLLRARSPLPCRHLRPAPRPPASGPVACADPACIPRHPQKALSTAGAMPRCGRPPSAWAAPSPCPPTALSLPVRLPASPSACLPACPPPPRVRGPRMPRSCSTLLATRCWPHAAGRTPGAHLGQRTRRWRDWLRAQCGRTRRRTLAARRWWWRWRRFLCSWLFRHHVDSGSGACGRCWRLPTALCPLS